MSDEPLIRLAEAAGLSIDWIDADNRQQRVTPDVLREVLACLGLAADSAEDVDASLAMLDRQNNHGGLPPLMTCDQHHPLELAAYFEPASRFELTLENGEVRHGELDHQARLPAIDTPGYHQLAVADRQVTLAVAPHSCPTVAEVAGAHAWGLTVQLYSLRRPGDGGLGDTQALEELVRNAAAHGADALGISPVHAMFGVHIDQYSPYSPSSRLFYNVLHAAPGAILGELPVRQAIEACGLAGELERLERLELIDWPAVAQSRQRLLRQLFDDFRQGENPQQLDFDSFRSNGGEALENHCRFEALHAHLRSAEGHPQHWRNWPEDYRDPASPAVEKFAREHADEVSYHAFGQWLMARGLERAQVAARSAGMRIGLVSDLAVGADGGGSQAWSRQAELLASLSVGAPPDVMNRDGQNWGISAFSPWGLKQNGFRAYIEMLRANLAHSGGMRIDHVLGLKRLWVMPAGADPKHGVYLNFPFDDMLRLLCLEAWRHRAVILGEDLGTIPPGLRDVLAARGILGMRVLLFEQHDGHFQRAGHYSSQALATTTTHDIPTLTGWWNGHDIDWRIKVGQVEEADRDQQWRAREHERAGLNRLLCEDSGRHSDQLLSTEQAVDAAACFLGHTPAPLVLLPVEDALGLEEQTNMPGIVETHPNWRRRYPGDSATLLDGDASRRRLECLARARHNHRGAAHR
ncbi:4-alpha-glucanotransferase [Stutzerimonas frequens]|uniref:4-alpha-glucanotransferase n=1 Tax=Stutzerimonas frequens TaxID=2968969 RepID=A0ABX6XRU4_9GAMM|nr:4-alpha-glucanotransferase [Stutzerimonas frequens]MCQ4303482.1 4-alpha-glucanotransferase [Stutzerimonas frequens]PNF48960.1 4-alpha-glucanotransferase [Stutzerimonas frequens]QPT16745.1 4-alpha-glucanotransferase [Stutzerimonas frequens]